MRSSSSIQQVVTREISSGVKTERGSVAGGLSPTPAWVSIHQGLLCFCWFSTTLCSALSSTPRVPSYNLCSILSLRYLNIRHDKWRNHKLFWQFYFQYSYLHEFPVLRHFLTVVLKKEEGEEEEKMLQERKGGGISGFKASSVKAFWRQRSLFVIPSRSRFYCWGSLRERENGWLPFSSTMGVGRGKGSLCAEKKRRRCCIRVTLTTKTTTTTTAKKQK